ncbi:MAG TPA: hypothetical protein VIG44_12860 [Thermomicrobiales bacterium]
MTGVPATGGTPGALAPPTAFGALPTGAEEPGGSGGRLTAAAGGCADDGDDDEADVGAATVAGDAAALLATGATDACAVVGAMDVPVAGAFIGSGVGVHAGRVVGLTVAAADAGALPSSGPIMCDGVSVGGSGVGDGEGVLVAGVPVADVAVGDAAGVTHWGIPSVAAPAALPDQPIITARMPVVMLTAITTIHRRSYVLCPCIAAPSLTQPHHHHTPCPTMSGLSNLSRGEEERPQPCPAGSVRIPFVSRTSSMKARAAAG